MAKKNRSAAAPAVADGDVPVVGMREPCPCGSGRRYKACHGKSASAVFVGASRPFEGFVSECDIVAMREIVPAASTELTLVGEHAGRKVRLVTVLPMAWPALVREDGEIMLGLQVNVGSGDASRDLADALVKALAAEPGEPVALGRVTVDSPRLQDLVDVTVPLDITVYENFDFWIDGNADVDPSVKASLERAAEYANPTHKLTSVPSAYWTHMGEKEFLRWVMPEDEDLVLNGLARLHAAGEDSLGDGTRFIGMFRAQGVVAPVWDVTGLGANAVDAAAGHFSSKLAAAITSTAELTNDERRARAGITTRQVTLR